MYYVIYNNKLEYKCTLTPLVLGFVVCLLLYAVLSLQDVCACTVCVAHIYNVCGTWDRPTNKVRTIDSFRVNGCKWFKCLVT